MNYLDSKRITGTSAETKPSNVQTGSIFTETDTGLIKWYNGTSWV